MTPTPTMPSRSVLPAILWGGLIAGVWDLSFAFVYYVNFGAKGTTVLRVMQSVAGGLLGKATFDGGAASAALGVVLHFCIATGAAATYVLASRRLPLLVRQAVPCGLGYGAAVYFFMNMVVLPLSAYHSRAFPPPLPPGPIVAHMIGVGLPIALVARRYAR